MQRAFWKAVSGERESSYKSMSVVQVREDKGSTKTVTLK